MPVSAAGDGAQRTPVPVQLEPVGRLRSPRTQALDDDWGEVVATVVLDGARFSADALRGLEAFSHLEVVYLFHLVEGQAVETGARRPRGNPDWPEVGIFAQRARCSGSHFGSPAFIGKSVSGRKTVER